MNWVKKHKTALWIANWSAISLVGVVCLIARITPGVMLLLVGCLMIIKEVRSNAKIHAG